MQSGKRLSWGLISVPSLGVAAYAAAIAAAPEWVPNLIAAELLRSRVRAVTREAAA